MKNRALGMIETYGYVGAIEAADICMKSANVELIGCELVKGGLVTVHIRGDVAAVKASIDAAQTAVMKIGRLISTHVIARPSKDVERILPNLDPDDPKDPKETEEKKIEIEEEIEKTESQEKKEKIEENKEETESEDAERDTDEREDVEIDIEDDTDGSDFSKDSQDYEEDQDEEDQDEEEILDQDQDDRGLQAPLKTRDELKEITTVKLRSLARRLEDNHGIPFPIERNQIKYARKRELIEAIMEYYEGVN